jgi:hypothetical protein
MADEDDNDIDPIIEIIGEVLPAATREQIAERLAKKLRYPVSISDVDRALSDIRKNPFDYDFTVPYVKRGIATEGEAERYFVIPVNRSDKSFRVTPENRADFMAGALSTALALKTTQENSVNMFREYAKNETSQARRELYNDAADDCAYTARKTGVLIRTLSKVA